MLTHLRVFGAKAWAHVPAKHGVKFDDRAIEGIYIEYVPNKRSYLILQRSTGKLIESRDVKFDEGTGEPQRVVVEISDGDEETESVKSSVKAASEGDEEGENNGNTPSDENPTSTPANSDDDDTEPNPDTVAQPPPLRRSMRKTRAPDRDDHPKFDVGSRKTKQAAFSVGDEQAFAALYDPDYFMKMKIPEAPLWQEAMNTEMEAQKRMGTYEEVMPPPGANILDCRWVYAEKRGLDGKGIIYKARVVAKGYTQIPGVDYDETYAPTMHKSTFRTLLALAAYHDMEIHQMDVKAAFLHGELKETIFMHPPNGFPTKTPGHVWRLKKSLYGLKQAARAWHAKVDEGLGKLGFTPTSSDPSVYIKRVKGELPCIVATHVDDSPQIVKGTSALNNIKSHLADIFEMKDLGEVHWFLGLEITRDRPRRTIALLAERYTLDILNRFNMLDARPVSTPMAATLKLERLEAPSDPQTQKLYQQMLGCLMYAMVCTRPDLAYSVGALAQHSAAPGPEHISAIKHVFRYLTATRNAVLVYDGSVRKHKLVGYSDSDWAGDPINRRFIAGYTFIIGTTAISWASKKQQSVALSSTEGEYMASTIATCEAIFLRRFIGELGFPQSSITLLLDNQSAMQLAHNPVHHSRTKHIDVRPLYSRKGRIGGDQTRICPDCRPGCRYLH